MPKNKTQKEIRKLIWRKTNNCCAACGRKVDAESDRTIEHIVPKSLGGTDDQRNLMPLCKQCNQSRATSEINIDTYYSYASERAREDAHRYIFDWKLQHTTADGSMIVDRYGIQE